MLKTILPQRLQAGDQVALIGPAFRTTAEQVDHAIAQLEALNLRVVNLVSPQQPDGYFAGYATTVVHHLHDAFANPAIKALISVRGGYGCARLLPLLNWDLIQANPKIVLGFSDFTALLLAIHQKTGLITFHGPGAAMQWSPLTRDFLQHILFTGIPTHFNHPPASEIKVLRGGSAQGVLIGGNLSVFASLIGSPYLPNAWRDKILFLEDVHEEVYRLDRMLMQLQLTGILSQIRGLIFGQFNDCTTKIPHSFSVMQLLTRIAEGLNIPVMANMTFGHQSEMLTLPIGAIVEMDADRRFLVHAH